MGSVGCGSFLAPPILLCIAAKLAPEEPARMQKAGVSLICMCADQAETTHSQQHSSSVNKPLITVPWMGQSAKNKSSWRPKLWTGESARVCVQPSPHLKREAHNAQPRRSGSRTKLNFSSHPPTPHDGRQAPARGAKRKADPKLSKCLDAQHTVAPVT
jgi:hypothetical protein